jgi:putative protease
MASHATQKSLGKKVGKVVSCRGNMLIAKLVEPLHAGDGICYFSEDKKLEGFLVNRVEGDRIYANKTLGINSSVTLWRNNDFVFEKQLQANSAERKVAVSMILEPIDDGLRLTLTDEDGCSAVKEVQTLFEPARDQNRMREGINTQLSKFGGTPFEVSIIELRFSEIPFIQSSLLNQLRRDAVDELVSARLEHFRPKPTEFVINDIPYFETHLDARGNVVNKKAEAFYRRHGVTQIDWGIDMPEYFVDNKAGEIPLMTTKYCLRYELHQCLKHKCNKSVDADYQGDLFLLNNGKRFRLHFDCGRCEMQVFPIR